MRDLPTEAYDAAARRAFDGLRELLDVLPRAAATLCENLRVVPVNGDALWWEERRACAAVVGERGIGP